MVLSDNGFSATPESRLMISLALRLRENKLRDCLFID